MTTNHEAWLALTKEDPIEPEMPICDPHHHLWDRPGDRYLLEDVLQDTGSGHNITQTVFIDCESMYRQEGPKEMQPIGETEFVQAIAARSASGQYGTTRIAAGIVSFADLTLGDAIKPVLEAHMEAGKNYFRGIRYTSPWTDSSEIITPYRHRPKGLLLDHKFREGFACLREYNLSFDSWLYHPQITELTDLARAFPDQPIILDHIGSPLGIGPYSGKLDEAYREWNVAITSLIDCPNVVLKLGGLGMPINGFGWNERQIPINSADLAEALTPYYAFCIEQFGVNRCMFESNFPVDKLSYSYNVMWNAFKRMTRDLSPGERAALFHDTATRVYRLSDNP